MVPRSLFSRMRPSVLNNVNTEVQRVMELHLQELRNSESKSFSKTKNEGRSKLHIAVLNNSIEKALQLLKNGADVNVLDSYNRTPLFYALRPNCLELTCMLLYYGANVTLCDCKNDTPFVYAYDQYRGICVNKRDEINKTHPVLQVLVDYFDETFLDSSDGVKSFLTAAKYLSPLTIDILNISTAIVPASCNIDEFYPFSTGLYLSIRYETSEVFKRMWPNFDYRTIVRDISGLNSQPEYKVNPFFHEDTTPVPFLIYYLRDCNFNEKEWIHCLYLMLDSPVAVELVENCSNYRPLHRRPNENYFMQEVFESFFDNHIEQPERVDIIYTLLSLGSAVNYFEFNVAFQMYGFNDELEALLYGVKSYKIIRKSRRRFLLLPMCILGSEVDYHWILLYQMYRREIKLRSLKQAKEYYKWYTLNSYDRYTEHKYLLNSLGYFAISDVANRKLYRLAKKHLVHSEAVCAKLDTIPSVPSLLETSRNAYRIFIKETYEFKYPYQFHDFIKRLNIPQHLKDILRFKTPIY